MSEKESISDGVKKLLKPWEQKLLKLIERAKRDDHA